MEDFNSLTKYLFRFCGLKNEITKIVVLNVGFFLSLEMSLYDTSAKMYSSVLNCLPHKVQLKGPKFGAVLCKKKKRFHRCFADGLHESLVSSVAQANHCIDIDYASIDKGLSDLELRFSGNDQKMLWKISVTVKHLIKKASPAFTKFYKMDGEILEAEQKIYASFSRERGLC